MFVYQPLSRCLANQLHVCLALYVAEALSVPFLIEAAALVKLPFIICLAHLDGEIGYVKTEVLWYFV